MMCLIVNFISFNCYVGKYFRHMHNNSYQCIMLFAIVLSTINQESSISITKLALVL